MMIHATPLPTMHEGVGLAAVVESEAVTPMAPTLSNGCGLGVLPLDSVRAYKRDLAPHDRYPSLSPEQRDAYTQALVEQVRAGDTEAREQLIAYILSGVVRQAERYFYTYGWLHPTMDLSDLIQAGNVELLEQFDHALSHPAPCAYLLTCTLGAIRSYRRFDSLIPLPATRSARPPRFCSLDRPLSVDDERPLIEVLPAPSESPGDERDFTALYQAIDQLTELQRQTILRRYGLCGLPEQERQQIDEALHGGKRHTQRAERRALLSLCSLLKSSYLGQGEHEVVLSEPLRGPREYRYIQLKEEERARLDTACAALHARGERITYDALRTEARINGETISAYLYQRGMGQPPADRLERLRAAHAMMAAQGVSMTILELSRRAHVDHPLAREYLRQQGIVSDQQQAHSKEAIKARLDHAYEQLTAEHGPRITIDLLTDAAHTECKTATVYLRQRRIDEGLPPPEIRRVFPKQQERREQLIAQAYEEMLQRGTPIKVNPLCRASGMQPEEVKAFLAARGMTWEQQQERERMARLEAAYRHLLEQGQPFGVTLLSRAARVSMKHARRFWAEQQGQAKGTAR